MKYLMILLLALGSVACNESDIVKASSINSSLACVNERIADNQMIDFYDDCVGELSITEACMVEFDYELVNGVINMTVTDIIEDDRAPSSEERCDEDLINQVIPSINDSFTIGGTYVMTPSYDSESRELNMNIVTNNFVHDLTFYISFGRDIQILGQ